MRLKDEFDRITEKAEKEKVPLYKRIYGKFFEKIRNVSYKREFLAFATCAVLGLTGGIKSYQHEKVREARIPLGFSEIHQIETDAFAQGKVAGEGAVNEESKGMARTLHLAGLNDLTMKIFECWNEANEKGGDVYREFARELEKRFNTTEKKHYYELGDLFSLVSESAKHVKKQFGNFAKIQNAIPAIAQNLNNSWTERHHDNYHTEWYLDTETETDSEGHVHSHTVLKSREVYDNTDHYYYYHKENGEQAVHSLEHLISSVGDIHIKEKILTASKTNPEGEKSAVESRKKGTKEIVLSKAELRQIADTWYSGATITLNEPGIYTYWDKVVEDAKEWGKAKLSAKDVAFRTHSRSDNGPEEYRTAHRARDDCKSLGEIVNIVLSTVNYTESNLPVLRESINEFMETARNDSNYKKIGKKVLSQTKEIYTKNFQKGFDVERFRGWVISLWVLAGLAVGAGAGFGAGYGIERIFGEPKYEEEKD